MYQTSDAGRSRSRASHPDSRPAAQAQLSQSLAGERVPLIFLAVLVSWAVLAAASDTMTWAGLLMLVAAAITIGGWVWYLTGRLKRAKVETRRRALFLERFGMDQIVRMRDSAFEHLFADLLRLDGHQDVQVVGGADDGGIDVTSVDPQGRRMAYQCKGQKDPVGPNIVRELAGSLTLECRGRHAVLVTNSLLSDKAKQRARAGRIEWLDRDKLAEWTNRLRVDAEREWNASRDTDSCSPGRGVLLSGAIVALFAVVAGFYAAGSIYPARASVRGAGYLGPAAVIEADFAAINRHDWRTVWRLWAHATPGYGSGYEKMALGYRHTARDDVLSIRVRGDAVSTVVIAHETTGATQTYDFSFQVRAGRIVWGRSVLTSIGQAARPASDS
jgi:hypothetical protein